VDIVSRSKKHPRHASPGPQGPGEDSAEHPKPAPAHATKAPPGPGGINPRLRWGLLAAAILAGALLRLVNLGQSPPGMNQDEAVIAWNSYCLLNTGADAMGEPWPIFYCRALGVPHDMVSVYALIPFQAIGGLNTVTTRLPAAVGGIVTIFLVFLVGRRLFGEWVGLAAAAFLALNPWHVQQSRWGHEAPLCPLLVMLTLWLLLASDLPVAGRDENRKPCPILAAIAGAMAGVSCYGYAAIKIFLPVFLLLMVVVNWRGWWKCLRTRRGAVAIGAAAVGFALTFGPLLWRHVVDKENMGARGETTFVWNQVDPKTGQKISTVSAGIEVANRYIGHFLPDFLFVRGDHYVIQGPPGIGQFHWYMLPAMVLGAIFMIRALRTSAAARVLLVLLLCYPLPDILSVHWQWNDVSMHALRSLPGMCGLILLGALGLVESLRWLRVKARSLVSPAAIAFAVLVVILNAVYLPRFFGEFNRNPEIYHKFHVDLLEACEWLRPRLDKVDAVVCTTGIDPRDPLLRFNQPYIVTLVGLSYQPVEWFAEPHVVYSSLPAPGWSAFSDAKVMPKTGEWDVYTRYGKMHFTYDTAWVKTLLDLPDGARVVFILRPDERLARPGLLDRDKAHPIIDPQGKPQLLIFDETFRKDGSLWKALHNLTKNG